MHMPAVRAILKVYVQIRRAVGGLSSPARTERLEDPSLALKLAKLFWLIAAFWLPFTEMIEEVVGLEPLQEGLDLMMQALEPSLTQ